MAAVKVCIELRGGDGGVAQKLLDNPDVCSTLQKVSREGVPQGVGMEPADTDSATGALHDRIDALPSEPATADI